MKKRMNLTSACSYNHDGVGNCISKKTMSKILSSGSKLNPKIFSVLKNEAMQIGELNALLSDDVVNLLGEETVLEEMKNFKPVGPTNNDLLSNFNEDNIMRHLSQFDDTFYGCDVQLMDFPETHYKFSTSLTNFLDDNYKKINNGKIKHMGCVINTLRSDGDISEIGHWVAIFADFSNHTIEYFNSSGKSAPVTVFKWMKYFCKIYKDKTGNECSAINVSNVFHQKSDTECGVYAIYFISARMLGFPYKIFREKEITDSEMTRFRSFMMNPIKEITNKTLLKQNRLV
jgi:Ulp1 protease family, C-terminal catalytic domain